MTIGLLTSVVLIYIFGYWITFIIEGENLNWWERNALAFGLGLGCLTLGMFGLSFLGGRLTILNIVLFMTSILTFFTLVFFRRGILNVKKIKIKRPDFLSVLSWGWMDKIILGSILSLFLFASLIAVYWPVHSWDTITFYDFRGRIYTQDRTISTLPEKTGFSDYYNSYPLLTSLAHTWVYLFGGENPQFLYPLFYLSLNLVFFSLLKKKTGMKTALFFTLLLSTTPIIFDQATFAYPNLPYTFYLSLSALYLIQWIEDGRRSSFYLSVILLGLSTWVRTEPFWVVNIFTLLFYSLWAKDKKQSFTFLVLYSLIFFSFQQIWPLYVSYLHTQYLFLRGAVILDNTGAIANALTSISMKKILDAIFFIGKAIPPNWYPLWGLFLLSLMANLKRRSVSPLLLVIFASLTLLCAGTLYFSLVYEWWDQISGSVQRAILFIIPLMYFYVAVSVRNFFAVNDKNN